MDYSSYMETTIFRTAAMLGFRRLQSYMLPCLYALLIKAIKYFGTNTENSPQLNWIFVLHVYHS